MRCILRTCARGIIQKGHHDRTFWLGFCCHHTLPLQKLLFLELTFSQKLTAYKQRLSGDQGGSMKGGSFPKTCLLPSSSITNFARRPSRCPPLAALIQLDSGQGHPSSLNHFRMSAVLILPHLHMSLHPNRILSISPT